jgi:hypothetical protein
VRIVPIVTITRSQGIYKEHFFWLSLTLRNAACYVQEEQ